MLRTIKVLLIITVALWGFIGGLKNMGDWAGTLGAVQAASSMVTFEGGAESWQATSNVVVVWVGALMTMLSKLTCAVLCSIGATKMWKSRASEASVFNSSKYYALAGCGVAVAILFGGFIVIGETWFELWRSDDMRGPVLMSALRYGSMIALIALFVNTSDD
jgi:predicted small integral membrane protein